MPTLNIEQTTVLPCDPETAFRAWMDSKQHGEMIQGSAVIDPVEGGEFTIWNGSVSGETIKIDTEKGKIIQTWRYDYREWPKDKPSTLTLEFKPYESDKCMIVLKQTDVPEMYADDIASGWQEYYWNPMQQYFLEKNY